MKDLAERIHDRGVDELAMRLTYKPHDAGLIYYPLDASQRIIYL